MKKNFLFLIFCVLILQINLFSQTKYYVNVSVEVTGEGCSWGDAFNTIQEAILKAQSGDTIIVAGGTYYTDGITGFELKNGVQLYGGFIAKSGTTPSYTYEQNINAYQTILDAGSVGRVLTFLSGNSSTVCSGFTVQNGQTVDGGGVFLTENGVLEKCTIKNNQAGNNGGGVYNTDGSIISCVIAGNSATENGGGIYSNGKEIINSVVYGNYSAKNGGGIYTLNTVFTNCTVADNLAEESGGGIYNGNATTFNNSIVWGNRAVQSNDNIYGSITHSYNLVENGSVTSNQIISKENPFFTYPGEARLSPFSDKDYSLMPYSPAINLGNNVNLSTEIQFDVLGYVRIKADKIDLGAYEYQTEEEITYPVILPDTIYVDSSAKGKKDGSTWENAMTSLARAINTANQSTRVKYVLIAKGTYLPEYIAGTGTLKSDLTFHINRKNLLVKGGFANGGSSNTATSNTVSLSGNLSTDNASHVVILTNADLTLILENLTITAGNAKNPESTIVEGETIYNNNGGGIYNASSSPVLKTVTISSNKAENNGGGIYNEDGTIQAENITFTGNTANAGGGIYNRNSKLSLTSSILTSNTANTFGGAIYNNSNSETRITLSEINSNVAANNGGGFYNSQSTIEFLNTEFRGNKATNGSGGALYNDNAKNILNGENILFSGNYAKLQGGAIYNTNSAINLISNTISGNYADEGGGIYNDNSTTVTIRNTILWGNSNDNISGVDENSLDYCALEDGEIKNDNKIIFDGDPLFGDPVAPGLAPSATGVYTLISFSPVLNIGNNSYSTVNVDLNNNSRMYGVIDLGAYEYQGSKNRIPSVMYVDASAKGNNEGAVWTNAMTTLGRAVQIANSYSEVDSILIAEGTYYPTATGKGEALSDRDKSFIFRRRNLVIEGGYPTGGGARDIQNNPVVLSGDLNKNNTLDTFDSYHVIVTMDADTTLILDGLTVVSGFANMNNIATIYERDLSRRNGGGIYNINSSPVFRNMVISFSNAANGGGGVYNENSDPVFINSSITNNYAISGGAVYNDSSSPRFYNITIAGNTATNHAALYNINKSFPVFCNSIISQNKFTVLTGKQVYNHTDSKTFYSYSMTDEAEKESNGVDWGNNQDSVYPYFRNGARNDYRLLPYSSLINTGNNDSLRLVDVNYNGRIYGGRVDLGAFEYDGQTESLSNKLYVDETASANKEHGLDWKNAMTSLANAIEFANHTQGIDSILVAEGTYYPEHCAGYSITDRNKSFFISRNNLAILGGYPAGGNGVKDVETNLITLSGDIASNANDAYHTMIIADTDNTLHIAGFTITGGNANNNLSITVGNKSLPNNVGGGLVMLNSNAVLRNINVSGNAGSQKGGGFYLSGSSPEMVNIAVTENTTINEGAGIYITDLSKPIIINADISDNSATNRGGGLYVSGNSDVVLTNVTLTENTAASAGGIYNTDADVLLQNSIVWQNRAASEEINNVFIENGSITYSHSILENGRDENGVWNSAFGDADDTTIADNPLFFNPYLKNYQLLPYSPALDSGKDSYIQEEKDLTGEARKKNLSVDMGAYEYQDASTEIKGTLYVDKNATGKMDGTSWTNAITSLARAVNIAETEMEIKEILIAEGTYYPEYKIGFNTANIDKTFLFTRSGLKLQGGYSPGGIGCDPEAYPVVLSGDLNGNNGYDGNDARHVVATINADNSLLFDGLTVTGGNAYYNNLNFVTHSGNEIYYSKGGGIYNINSSPTFNNVKIKRNRAYNSGGGMYNYLSSPILQNDTIMSNSSAVSGGGIYNEPNSNPQLKDIYVSKNSAGGNGGGIYNDSSSPILSNVLISENSAKNGGGLYNFKSSPVITDSIKIISNTASVAGGGLYNDSTVFSISHAVINGNKAKQYGGGMYNNYSSPLIRNSKIQKNSSDHHGGGIYNNDYSNPEITNVYIQGNLANNDGGAVFNYASSPILFNVLLTGNMVQNNSGGAFYNSTASSPKITNATISNNKANLFGGAFYNQAGSSPVIQNSIIYGNVTNKPETTTHNIYNNNSAGEKSVPTYACSMIENSRSTWNLIGNDLGNNIELEDGVDPAFVEFEPITNAVSIEGNYELLPCSPLINKGNNAYVQFDSKDLNDNDRIYLDDAVDLGPYEFQDIYIMDNFDIEYQYVVYNGQQQMIETEMKELPKTLVITYNGDTNPPVDAGEYDVHLYVTLEDDRCESFETRTKLFISKYQPILILNDSITEYTGNPVALIPEYESPDPLVLTYSYIGTFIDGTSYNSSEPPMDAGEYTVTVISEGTFNIEPDTVIAKLIIEKAEQHIEFNLDPDYATLEKATYTLMATAVPSDLPVVFTVEETNIAGLNGNTLNLLDFGFVNITATQSGNNNFHPADSVSKTLEIVSIDASIHKLIIGENEQPCTLRHYFVDCDYDSDSVSIEIEAAKGAFFSPKDTVVNVSTPSVQYVEFYIQAQDGRTDSTHTIIIEKRFDFDEIIVQKWNNVLIVNNNKDNNGGYEFESFRWFSDADGDGNFEEIAEGQSYSSTREEKGVQYYVEFTTVDGTILRTCPKAIDFTGDLFFTIYPNPVERGGKLTIRTESSTDIIENGYYFIYSDNGALVDSGKITTRVFELILPDTPGIYILKTTTEGVENNFTIIIR